MTLLSALNDLTAHHTLRCTEYGDFVRSFFSMDAAKTLEKLPFVPVRAFKHRILKSIDDRDVYRTMSSSGTTGEGKSVITVDRETARLQTRALVGNAVEMLGPLRGPVLIIAPPTVSGVMSAQTAAINGFGVFATEKLFVYDAQGMIVWARLREFMKRNLGRQILVIGFTFQVWVFLSQLERDGRELDLSRALLLHGGGWKKLTAEQVTREEFNRRVRQTTGCKTVRNYYGMIEQTGSVYFECSAGYLHAPAEGGAIIRNPITLEVTEPGEEGLVQVFSSIQKSYPGHSLLTEDIGSLETSIGCGCGRVTQRLRVTGRLNRAEIRGCSDAVA